ncbi:hypothetical protein [Enterococcus hirae]|uniref:hypothetical protein n=1 Tax=Enterococcus hirae TaxID=1354 RepID=UPI0013701C26|nr:hypothetical protein [Enterococcus hirae]NAE18367.1 hypothetical protein [Enterococcus hirae]
MATSASSKPPRRSALQGRPHLARQAGEAARHAEGDDDVAATPDSHDETEADAQRYPSGRPRYAGQVSTVYFPTKKDKERALSAFAVCGGAEGYASASEWMVDVIMEATEKWERERNEGEPFTLPRRGERRGRRRLS